MAGVLLHGRPGEQEEALPSQAGDIDVLQGDSGCTRLWLAAERGDAEAIACLACMGASVTASCVPATSESSAGEIGSRSGVTPLYVAAQNGHVEAVACLCAYGALPSAIGRLPSKAAALHIAAQQGHEGVLKELLSSLQLFREEGKDRWVVDNSEEAVDVRTRQGVTPLMLAAYQGHTQCVRLLLEAGANLCLLSGSDNKLRSPLDWAAAGGHSGNKELCALLQPHLQSGAQTHSVRAASPFSCKDVPIENDENVRMAHSSRSLASLVSDTKGQPSHNCGGVFTYWRSTSTGQRFELPAVTPQQKAAVQKRAQRAGSSVQGTAQ